MRAHTAFALLYAVTIFSSLLFAAEQPPEVLIGQRLFFETRFAQAFFAQCKGNVNATNIPGDPALATTQTTGSPLAGTFTGKTMNCRACHLEDEFEHVVGAGVRTYSDFARRSPIPVRDDGKTTTTRNSPALVSAQNSRTFFFQHFDAEFATAADLVIGGFTGRNFGWLANESGTAIKHIAKVIREDDGTGELAKNFGGAYAKVIAGDKSVPAEFLLPKEYRMNTRTASDARIVQCVANLVAEYLKSLDFARDASGAYSGSPYDVFLIKNSLPRVPNADESRLAYSRRLRAAVNALTAPIFVTPADGAFTLHSQAFVFGADELAGLKLFMAEAPAQPPPPGAPRPAVGNCIACHTAPEFTDFSFHNTGETQLEYDGLHGRGAFQALKIPTLTERAADPANALPASAKNPTFKGTFRSVASRQKPGETDLGLWNVYLNPDLPKPQKTLTQLLTLEFGNLDSAAMLDKTIASFKTPGLRDLGHSQPYQHTGRLDTIRDVMDFYLRVSQDARDGVIRNADPKLAGITLNPQQAIQITRFLESLNEDFAD